MLAVRVGIDVITCFEHEDSKPVLGEDQRGPTTGRTGSYDDDVVKIGIAQSELTRPPALTLVLTTTPSNALLFFASFFICTPILRLN